MLSIKLYRLAASFHLRSAVCYSHYCHFQTSRRLFEPVSRYSNSIQNIYDQRLFLHIPERETVPEVGLR